MKDSVRELGEILQKRRKSLGLSQRSVGKMIGVPQSHISKIEAGLVDLQASTLIELTRILELELMFIPLPLVRTVTATLQGAQYASRPMYRLDEEDENEE